MNRALLTTSTLVLMVAGYAQNATVRGEFATNPNGLMYSDGDIKALRFIVDSLNLRFKTCDLNKTYYAWPQTRVYNVTFSSKNNDLKSIIGQIEKKADFYQVITTFAPFISGLDTSELFIRTSSKGKNGEYYFLEGNPGKGYDDAYRHDENNKSVDFPAGWTYDYSPKTRLSKEYRLNCRYFPQQWQQTAIPEKYGRLILYVDCMIDTSASVFLTDKFSYGWRHENEKNIYSNLEELANYLDDKMNQQNNNSKIRNLREAQVKFAVKELREDAGFRSLLSKTIDDYVKNKTPEHDLEYLATEMNMYDRALLMKRCYRIMGNCSQDSRPREHARDIAILAAQAHSWDIFLRAHLDIMNDRFERATDGSYAWGDRKTYLKELEELNLNIVDLMLGLSLRAQNVADNHYYGTIWRMGWALTESKEKNVFEEKAVAMMKDDSLDEFNRGLIFLLYKIYIRNLPLAEAKQKTNFLKDNIRTFPLFIQSAIREMKAPETREEDAL